MYDLVGKTIGKYQIIERLHQTAATEIYKGFSPSLNRYVVVNVLKAEFVENKTIIQRFLDQNDIAAEIQHPNISPMIDFGEENGIYFRVLMFASEGDWVENKKWFNNNQAVLSLFSQLSSALAYIHNFGYVFLNLRPSNIFFDDQRKAMLGDFGIAVSAELSKTDPYCSPEVQRGETIDHRADIYALGVLLFELLTGNPPNMERYVSLRSLRPDLPQEVEKVILKAMSDRPEDRFQSIKTFQAALQAAFRYTTSATDATPVPADQRPKKSKVWLIVLVTALVALCLGAAVMFAISRAGRDDTIDEIIEETVEVPSEPEVEVELPTEPEGEVEVPPQPGNGEDGSLIPPVCNSVFPALGLGAVGIIAVKNKTRAKHKERNNMDI